MQSYRITVQGESPLIMHSSAGLDPGHPLAIEISTLARKKGSNRTEADDARIKECETLLSLWLDEGRPAVPVHAIRSTIENAARKLKQGPDVREGLLVTESDFHYDTAKYGSDLDKLGMTTQFTVPVVVQRNRIMRTRAKFDLDWTVEFVVQVDEELVDERKLKQWVEIAGQRIGFGDWRPAKSGHYGRFSLQSVEAA